MLWGVERGWWVGLTTLPASVIRLSRQCGTLNISQSYRPPLLYFTLSTVCDIQEARKTRTGPQTWVMHEMLVSFTCQRCYVVVYTVLLVYICSRVSQLIYWQRYRIDDEELGFGSRQRWNVFCHSVQTGTDWHFTSGQSAAYDATHPHPPWNFVWDYCTLYRWYSAWVTRKRPTSIKTKHSNR
jgi:hypothetical protein